MHDFYAFDNCCSYDGSTVQARFISVLITIYLLVHGIAPIELRKRNIECPMRLECSVREASVKGDQVVAVFSTLKRHMTPRGSLA